MTGDGSARLAGTVWSESKFGGNGASGKDTSNLLAMHQTESAFYRAIGRFAITYLFESPHMIGGRVHLT